MKCVFALLLLCIAVFAFAANKVFNSDPEAAARDARAAIAVGMSWQEVINVANEPSVCRTNSQRRLKQRSAKSKLAQPDGEVEFDYDSFTRQMAADTYSEGFTFHYRYVDSTTFSVVFDGKGFVTRVGRLLTAEDLREAKERQLERVRELGR